ncbi:hypothetical protein PM030_05325 [Halorubrum ezzemoulense]|uniref:hypothetical protein n=1 Tax=Halorubrum ezzemoulense TaxID=337243 RepID=UPI00232B7B37|nr:hypothetical protein [Halorubrum ezzemoulense]MDB2281290.1 hypothetical protein [Halorubrum ezzemoulense]
MSDSPPSSKKGTDETQRDQEEEKTTTRVWETPVIRRENGEPIGISIFLNDDDLRELGMDIEAEDELKYQITKEKRVQIGNKFENWSED